jgi:hypothetical protein
MNILKYFFTPFVLLTCTPIDTVDAKHQTKKSFYTKPNASLKPKAKQPSINGNTLRHINKRHAHNSTATDTSKFFPSTTDTKIKHLISTTYQSHDLWTPSKTNPNRLTKEHTFSKPIGKTTNGKPAKTLKIVSDKNGEIITAFPSK